MGHQISLTITERDGEPPVSVQGEIPDSEWDHLVSFTSYSADLESTKFVQDGMPASLKINWIDGAPLSFETRLPNWDDVVVFLHYLRLLYLQSEPAAFHVACNILSKRLASPHIRSMVQLQRDIYSGNLMRTAIRISVDDTVMNSEEALSVWLNSHEYHRDPGKRQFLAELNRMLPLDASKVLFISLLTEKVKAISAIAGFVAVVLGERKSVTGLSRSIS
jgi:hypothetical protein